MFTIDNTVLIFVDVQGKLSGVMHRKETLFAALEKLVRGIQILGLPIVWCEQIPEKLGGTRPDLKELLEKDASPISKSSFSCCGEPKFMETLEKIGRKQVVMCGIETHICVYQTTSLLVEAGYDVQVVSDAVSSRTAENREAGLERIRNAGAALTSVEMILFELLRDAKHDAFREVAKIVK